MTSICPPPLRQGKPASARLAERSEPLMPNYVFVVHPRHEQMADDWTEVRVINGVVGPLKDAIGPLLIPAQVIEVMMTAEFEGVYDETKTARRARGEPDRNRLEHRFEIGRQFRVTEGAVRIVPG